MNKHQKVIIHWKVNKKIIFVNSYDYIILHPVIGTVIVISGMKKYPILEPSSSSSYNIFTLIFELSFLTVGNLTQLTYSIFCLFEAFILSQIFDCRWYIPYLSYH